MGFKITDEEAEKNRKLLKVSYDMYENSKKETRKMLKSKLNEDGTKRYTKEQIDEKIAMIDKAEEEIVQKYLIFGGTMEELKEKTNRGQNRPLSQLNIEDLLDNSSDNKDGEGQDDDFNSLEMAAGVPERNIEDAALQLVSDDGEDEDGDDTPLIRNNTSVTVSIERDDEDRPLTDREDEDRTFIPSRDDLMSDTNFDMVALPSNGECYPRKVGKISVSYLNAFDENIITAPNLYRDNSVIDTILKRKVRDERISCDDLLEGDRDAIILFLRATGFGTEYPITVTDNQTGKEFDTTIDLSTLRFKKFTLKGDANGWFDYTLPVSKRNIKFKFLTHKDVRLLDKADELESNMIRRTRLIEMSESIDGMIDADKNMDATLRVDLRKGVNALNKWADTFGERESDKFTHTFTNALELSVMSVDGNTDRKYIRNFVRNMNIRDSSALNKYISDNEPGIDYNITVERPESLGGGSTRVFLQIDQYLFLNVPE